MRLSKKISSCFLLLTLIVIIFFQACTKIIEIDIPEFPATPVINCLFSDDSVLVLKITKTVSPFDSASSPLSDATIQLYENDSLVESLGFSNGFYVSTLIPSVGKSYSIKAFIPGLNDASNISTSDRLPMKPILEAFTFRDSALLDQDGYPVSQAVINISVNSDDVQYYEVLVELMYKRSSSDTVYEKRIADYSPENYDPVITREGLAEFKPSTLVFSNELFRGSNYSLKINFQNELYIDDTYPHYKELKVIVHLRKVSESYYRYKRQLVIHQSSINSDFWSGTTEPSPMYSNIAGGYGIFAGYTEVLDTVTKYYYQNK